MKAKTEILTDPKEIKKFKGWDGNNCWVKHNDNGENINIVLVTGVGNRPNCFSGVVVATSDEFFGDVGYYANDWVIKYFHLLDDELAFKISNDGSE